MKEDEKVMKRVREHYEAVEEMGYEIVGVFLQGSQNYGLSYEGSDIDTKAIVIPKFNDFVLNKQPVSTTHVLPNNEHIDIKDIRLMFENFKKQNINFVEILFTKYKIMNPKYEALYEPMFDNNELIAHYNNYASVNCMAGMCLEKHKAMEHPYPATMEKIEKYKYDGKQLHHILRIHEFMENYIYGGSYKSCLLSNQTHYLIGVKKNEMYDLENARIVAKRTVDKVLKIKKDYMDNNPVVVHNEVVEEMNDVMLNIIRRSFISELEGKEVN